MLLLCWSSLPARADHPPGASAYCDSPDTAADRERCANDPEFRGRTFAFRSPWAPNDPDIDKMMDDGWLFMWSGTCAALTPGHKDADFFVAIGKFGPDVILFKARPDGCHAIDALTVKWWQA